jgi:hypothetical protein
MSINSAGSVFANQPIPAFKITSAELVDDQLLVYNTTEQAFVNTIRGSITTLTSIGGGTSLVAPKVDNDLQIKSLKEGTGITLTDDGTSITIDSDPSNVITGSNLGAGGSDRGPPFAGKVGFDLQFRTLRVVAGHITVGFDANNILIATQSEINTSSSVGTGSAASVVYGKTGENLEFRGILGGQQISAVNSGTDVLVSTDFGFTGADEYKLVQVDTTGEITVVPDGAAGEVLHSNGPGAGVYWSDQSLSISKTIRIEFDGTGNLSLVDPASKPAEFICMVSGNKITISHTLGTWPKSISYFGWDSTIAAWKYREPTGTYQVMLPSGMETVQFEINVIAAVAGSNVSGQAYVNMVF